MFKRYWIIAAIVAHLALGCGAVNAQEAETDSPEAPTSGAGETGRPQVPRSDDLGTIHLMDKNGALVPVYGMLLEDFQELHLKAQGWRDDESPEYSIRSMTASGEVALAANQAISNRVDLKVALEIIVQSEGMVRIPLQFGQAALRLPDDGGGFQLTAEDTEPLEADGEPRREYILWLEGKGEETVEKVVLDFAVPLSGIGRERRLLLSVPQALESELTLTVPLQEDEVATEVSSGAIRYPPKANPKGGSDLIVRGLRGDIDLKWWKTTDSEQEASPVVTADGSVVAVVDRREVNFEANLTLRAYGRELTHCEVLLPLGASLADKEYEGGYSVREVTSDDQDGASGDPSAPGRRLVEVSLAEPVKDSESTVITLRAVSGRKAIENGQFHLNGFEVVGAERQTGTVVVRESGEWDVRFVVGRDVDQDAEPPEELISEDNIAAFTYYKHPFELGACVYPKQTRISVEPHYELSIESNVAQLDATLKYAVRERESYELKIDLRGWQYDHVGPEQWVRAEACEVDDSGVLSIALQEGMMVEFELSLQARWPIDAGTESLELPLPMPVATSTGPTSLVVLAANNIDLREDRGKMKGLVRQHEAPPMEMSEFQQEPMYYLGEAGEVVFAAAMTVRQQEITVEVATEVGVTPAEVSVKQALRYDVRYEPANALIIRLPLELAERGVVDYSLDGLPVAAVDAERPATADFVFRKVALPGPRQGQFELTAEYTKPGPRLARRATTLCVVPLIVPEDAVLVGNTLSATVQEGIGVRVRPESRWQQVGSALVGYENATVLEYATDTSEPTIVLYVHQEDPDTSGSVVVEAAWIQTWMTQRQRRDRVAYRFESNRRRLLVRLPDGADAEFPSDVLIDGRPAEYETLEGSSPGEEGIRILLPRGQAPRQHVLELSYHFSDLRPDGGRMRIELPQLGEDVWIRRCYWQLVLPGSEHVVSAPVDYTAEYDWRWNGLWWGRHPVKDQKGLEIWVGAVHEDPVPEATSRYLFSTFGPPSSVELRTASRTTIVGGASALALLVGLLVIYVPAVRHPFFGLLVLVAVGASTTIWPGPAMLFAQAAGGGLVLALLGAFLYRGVARRRRRPIRREIPSSVLERGSTQAQFGSSEVELIRSTTTDPEAAAVHVSEQ